MTRRQYNTIVFVSTILFSVGFFYFRLVPKSSIRAIELLTLVWIIGHLVFFGIYDQVDRSIARGFVLPIILLILGVIASSISSYYVYSQKLAETLYFQRHLYAYLFYFLLFYINPHPKLIIKVILWLTVINCIIYIIQYFLYPNYITYAQTFFQRGTVRINLPGTNIRHIGFFLAINRFYSTNKLKYVFIIFLVLSVAILSGFRSTLAMYILLAIGYLISGNKVKNRVALLGLFFLMAFAAVFAFQSIITEMKESAEKDAESGSDYVRVRAAEYFMTKKNPNTITYTFGNGQPGETSRYAVENKLIALKYGYYLSDIGIIGFYYRFGIIPTFIVLLLAIQLVRANLGSNYVFIRLFAIFQLALMFNTVIVFDTLAGAILVSILLYMIDLKNSRKLQEEEN